MKRFSFLTSFAILILLLTGCMSQSPGAEDNQMKPSSNAEEKTDEEAADNKTKSNESKESAESAEKLSTEDIEIIKDNRKGINPVTIDIPAIDVKADIEHVGKLPDGRMGVPDNTDNVAWYEPGTKPGDPGNAVIAGHVDDLTSPAVFYNLHKLEKGDKIHVKGKKGKTLTFEVYKKKIFPRLDAPLLDIFGFTYASTLNLITCTGEYNPETTERADRLVVYTKLVQ
ncbi:class F sortase [Pseudalkalibacillus decolorationis]|uniref:class F sortase n=1 Tax=Pseudalkalibacillus decolorationis TaxID=163879 RepID=UPI0021498C48|nr:class F sortase [Pseudalkalibacillus decolorationis]